MKHPISTTPGYVGGLVSGHVRPTPAMDPQRLRELADPSHAAFEEAMRQTFQMVDPFNPPPPGSYARGSHEGICAALKTMRENYDRARRAAADGVAPCDAVQAWQHEEDPARVISAIQKAQALRDGGASASSVKPYSVPLAHGVAIPLEGKPNA